MGVCISRKTPVESESKHPSIKAFKAKDSMNVRQVQNKLRFKGTSAAKPPEEAFEKSLPIKEEQEA